MQTQSLLREAKEAEDSNDLIKAAALYEKLNKQHPENELPLNRLMVIYRKLKAYKKELSAINKAIRNEERLYKPVSNRKGLIAELSKKLSLSTGLINKNGEVLLTPDSISRLQKRKEMVLKKI